MITHDEQVVINRPIEAVWAFLTDISTYTRWQEDLIEARQTSPGPFTVGAKGITARKVMGQRDESTWEVTDLTPPSTFVLAIGGGLKGTITNRLEQEGSGTRVLARMHAEATGLLRIAEPVMAGVIKKGFGDGYRAMKRILESQS
ncbi:MAG TPA: SRPBCC family protein [Ktedonobacterales bacterium]|nr:SRPBCC family protein [Ktedonobacterales bacterium]